jgi:hypothetical protein
MTELTPAKSSPTRRSTWLAIIAAVVAMLGTSELLEIAIVTAGRIWAASAGAPDAWTEHLHQSGSNAWIVLLATRGFSFLIGGFVGAWVGPPRARRVLAWLVVVSLVVTAFEQLPPVRSVWWGGLWGLCAPLATWLGVVLAWRRQIFPVGPEPM